MELLTRHAGSVWGVGRRKGKLRVLATMRCRGAVLIHTAIRSRVGSASPTEAQGGAQDSPVWRRADHIVGTHHNMDERNKGCP